MKTFVTVGCDYKFTEIMTLAEKTANFRSQNARGQGHLAYGGPQGPLVGSTRSVLVGDGLEATRLSQVLKNSGWKTISKKVLSRTEVIEIVSKVKRKKPLSKLKGGPGIVEKKKHKVFNALED